MRETSHPVAIVGAGPYGLSIAAHLAAAGIPHRIFGEPMRTWRAGMPAGMLLKSEGFASSLSDPDGHYTLAAYCAERNLPYADTGWGVPVEVFAAYGEAFQRRFVPHLETVAVQRLRREGDGFALDLADGRRVAAGQVVLASGLHPYAHVPPEFAELPPHLVSHSRDAADLRQLAGRDVTVIGGGASALDVAASLHRAGARATVVARRSEFRFFPPQPPRLLDRLRAPQTPLGPGWKKLLCARAPLLFRLLPAQMRVDLVRRHLGPAPAYSVKETVEAHVRLVTGATIEAVGTEDGRARIEVRAGEHRHAILADHVVLATGYGIDLGRLACLDPGLRGEIRCFAGSPVLSSRFETTAPGLYVVGTPSAATFGPLLRFVCGAGFAARRLTGRFRRLRPDTVASPMPVLSTSAGGSTRIAFLTLTNDIGSERIVAQLGRLGAACAVIGASDAYAMASRHATLKIALPRRGGTLAARALVRGHLERLTASWAPDAIIPLDDLAARVLRRLAQGKGTSPALKALIVASTGDPAAYAVSLSREGMLTTAAARGLRVPETRRAPDLAAAAAAAEALGYPVVLKREDTCGGGGVDLVPNPEALPRLYAAARRRARLKQLIVAIVGRASGETIRDGRGIGDMLAIQAFLPGRLAMHTVACRQGRVLEGLSLQAVQQHPEPIGASTILAPLEHAEMAHTARALVGLFRLSGFVSFDFLIDEADRAHLIELNPRPIGSTHLGALFGHDLCGAYLADLLGLPAPEGRAARQGPVALFPREMIRDLSRLRTDPALLHDVPEDEPAVLALYLAHLRRLHPGQDSAIAELAIRTGTAPDTEHRPSETAPLRAVA